MDNQAKTQERYKILINGRNGAFVADFIQYTESYFKCLSTSDCPQDVVNHFEIFRPDAYVCFAETENSKVLFQTNDLREKGLLHDAPVIVICDDAIVPKIEYSARFTVDMVVKRPISAGNLALKIIRYFEEKKEQEEALKAAEAAAAEASAEEVSAVNAEVPEEQTAESQAQETTEQPDAGPELVSEEERDKANALKSADVMDKDELLKQVEAIQAEMLAKEKPKKHILVVDDDRTVLKMLKTALSDKYDVTTMVNGIMVEKFLETKKVDLVILDYEMPVETGAAVFKKIKANEKARKVPVCFLTGISDREKIMEVMALKPHGYMLKPIDMDMLFSTISNLIE